VHALRLIRELIECAQTAAKSRSDLLRCREVSIKRRFLLRCIGQTIAASASKQTADGKKHRCTAPAAADEPGPPTTKMEARPSDRNLLKDGLRLSRPATKGFVKQNHSVMLREREHFTERLALARP
jgi:hypothetical protein